MAVVCSSLPLAYTLMFHILSCRNSKILAMQVNLMCSMRNRKRRHSLQFNWRPLVIAFNWYKCLILFLYNTIPSFYLIFNKWTGLLSPHNPTKQAPCICASINRKKNAFIVQIYVLQKVISYSFTAKLAQKKHRIALCTVAAWYSISFIIMTFNLSIKIKHATYLFFKWKCVYINL